ncbi:type II glyceraldehyde-3-phosphate dehydrogenase, partial [Candidatus Woesearchaeota archaeon CG11_big_fil_rev_8_21_14_0_20_57_5]
KDLLAACDVIVDCSPKPQGLKNKEQYYLPAGVKVIYQGGEKAPVGQASFTAQCNYEQCVGLDHVRVVSCNTTGLARTIGAIDARWGVASAHVTLIRRAADPWDSHKGPINAIVPELRLPSHHGPDLQTILPHIPIMTSAVIVPTTVMHLHTINLRLRNIPTREEAIAYLGGTQRLLLVKGSEGLVSTAEIMDMARDSGAKRGDLMEVAIWEEGINVVGDELFFHQAVHQESDVVPENIDAIRAVMGSMSAQESMALTNKTLGIYAGKQTTTVVQKAMLTK